MDAKGILKVVPGLQATSLVAHNLKTLKKFGVKKDKKMGMKKPVKTLMKTGITNIVGVGMIKPTAKTINEL